MARASLPPGVHGDTALVEAVIADSVARDMQGDVGAVFEMTEAVGYLSLTDATSRCPCRGGVESDDLAPIEQSSSKVTSAPTARRFLVYAHERVSEM
jgi:hypothetical protein